LNAEDYFGSLVEVEQEKNLGIYISKDAATVVCIDSQSKQAEVTGCFSVRAGEQAEALPHVLASLISQGCSEREWVFSDVSVALDCAMFMQHNVHSDFADQKQIAATVRFDTEEALATDVSDVAITFQIASSGEEGADLTVFTAKKKMLSDILLSLQSSGMDPMRIEPDVNCLARYLGRKVPAGDDDQGRTMFGVLSGRSGYLMAPHRNGVDSQQTLRVRTFLLGSAKDRDGLLAREAIMTTALIEGGEPIQRMRVFDSTGIASCRRLGERLGMEAGEVELVGPDIADEHILENCADPVEFAIAYGAALGHLEKAPAVSFRDDFMPYQGKKLRMEKALKFFSVSVTVLLIAVGLYFQTRQFSVNKYRGKVRDRFAADYAAAMSNIKLPDDMTIQKAVQGLEKERRRLQKSKTGIPDDETVSSKLALVLDAFNKSAAQTKLAITSISVSKGDINVVGSTTSRANTNRLFATIKQNGLDIVKTTLETEPGLDKFNIRVVPRKK